jgi:hypothetical protein
VLSDGLFVIIGSLFGVVIFPFFILYSRFIYLKYGVFQTKFNDPKYHPFKGDNFKEFISANKFNKMFGIVSIIVWVASIMLMPFMFAK